MTTRSVRPGLPLAGLIVILSAVWGLWGTPASAQSLDMERFDGRWYEIARRPNRLQHPCNRITIDFTARSDADRYSVNTACVRTDNGQTDTLRANARADVEAHQFRMTLTGVASLGGLAGQTYQVFDHAPDYSWAILALPNKRFWWIWTRTPNPSAAVRRSTLARAAELGFDTSNVVTTGG